MDAMDTSEGVLSIEIFVGADSAGMVMMTVPCRCGLKWSDTLRIDGLTIVALQARSILPIDFPELTVAGRDMLAGLVQAGGRLAVGEFTSSGLLDSYFLDVVVGG